MELDDPIAVYNAASNVEAIQIADFLVSVGIKAHASKDESAVGVSIFGAMPEIHKPQVWVSRRDKDIVVEVLARYEARKRMANPPKQKSSEPDIEVTCEDCGKTSSFAAELNGTIQRCPKCWGHVDVGEFDWPDVDFGEEDEAA